MVVREAKLADIPTLLDFQLKLALETEDIQLEIQPLTQGMQRLFRDPTRGKYYVAEEENDVVGCLMITFEWSEWRCGTIYWIQSVYVAASHRKRGVFKEMYQHVHQIVSEDPDLKGIRLYVNNSNEDAKSVYSGLGMNGEHYSVFEWMKQIPNS